jgi:hypothetical protein
MTQTRLPRLSEMTPDEWKMIDAYLSNGSFLAAARYVGCHRNTVQRAYFRYQLAIRKAVETAKEDQKVTY